MVSNNANTPAMRQYLAAKAQHPDALLFFRMGDFYELFFEDAVVASQLLELTLTSRNKNDENPVPMAGVPHHAANGYIQRLVDMGKKVAICEQMEDPALAVGVVRREVTHVITPGVNLDADSLDSRSNNYLMVIWDALDGFGLAYADASTSTLRLAVALDKATMETEVFRIEPRELLITDDAQKKFGHLFGTLNKTTITVRPAAFFSSELSKTLSARLSTNEELAGCLVLAVGGLLAYLQEVRPQALRGLTWAEVYRIQDTMLLEPSTIVNLELMRTIIDGKRQGSLLWILDRTITAMGARLLRQWVQFPLLVPDDIRRRHDAVETLKDDTISRETLRDHLKEVYDMERLSTRIQAGCAVPRDFAALRASLEKIPEIRRVVGKLKSAALRKRMEELPPLDELRLDLQTTLVDNPPVSVKDGGLIRHGVNKELDELTGWSKDGKAWVLRYEAEQKKRTQIQSLKVGYNKVFGYYIEITKANVHLVPKDYLRKQTLANGERYFTEELKEYEDKILSADERRIALEIELFEALKERVANEAESIAKTAKRLAELDVYCGLADLAKSRGYVRPVLDQSRVLDIRDGRHPVIEAILKEPFVPNDVEINADNARLMLITGPNMAGKSTVMRQTALIVLMAQLGSFVPAESARIGIVDRIFTRVGAADNLTRGQSTFMVEMMETATILKKATERSLIILDEIGRGTSTFDGVSIAWAVAEYIVDNIRARTLFATHYHELTALEETRQGILNKHIAVKEWNEDIVFLRKLANGATNRSYGIQVGRLAGLPNQVIMRAKEILRDLEEGLLVVQKQETRVAGKPESKNRGQQAQLNLFGPPKTIDHHPVMVELAGVSPDSLSPKDALLLVYRLKQMCNIQS
ncbi:MAG: DNA mismatch repair protein MutS [Myxococcales bacterium]|nr:DNA mismatch repair protein MutS [Myxococcales bacterium]